MYRPGAARRRVDGQRRLFERNGWEIIDAALPPTARRRR